MRQQPPKATKGIFRLKTCRKQETFCIFAPEMKRMPISVRFGYILHEAHFWVHLQKCSTSFSFKNIEDGYDRKAQYVDLTPFWQTPTIKGHPLLMGLKCKSARIALIFFKTTKRGTFTGSSLQFALKNESKINFKTYQFRKISHNTLLLWLTCPCTMLRQARSEQLQLLMQ